jgi:hypothetical protein
LHVSNKCFIHRTSCHKHKVKTSQFPLHISYFLQKCKKGKPGEMDLPYLKTISQVLNPLLRFWIHSSNMQSGLVTCSLELSDF